MSTGASPSSPNIESRTATNAAEITNPHALSEWATERHSSSVNRWRQELQELGITFSRVEACGSLQTGHFRGPRPRNNSFNPSCPAEYADLVEADVKFLMPKGASVSDKELIATIERITGAKFERTLEIPIPGSVLTITFLYKYETLAPGVGFEWEIDIVTEPYYNHANHYKQLVGPAEVAWEADIRHVARELGMNFDDLAPLKAAQYNRALCRAVYNFAFNVLATENAYGIELPASVREISPPLKEPIPVTLEELVARLLKGETGAAGLDYPSDELLIPDNVRQVLTNGQRMELLTIPSEPAWVPVFRKFAETTLRQRSV